MNSFGLLFIYYLDDLINTFEKDPEFLFKEDINLFVKQIKNLQIKNMQNKTAVRIIISAKFKSVLKKLGQILLSFAFNLYHFCQFVTLLISIMRNSGKQ